MIRIASLAALALAWMPAFAQDLAPLPAQPAPVSSHAPFESGDCLICHAGGDAKRPGPVKTKGAESCIGCHEEFNGVLKRPHVHFPAKQDCTSCHNPHNAKFRKLLLADTSALCTNCHTDIAKKGAASLVKHKALTTGAQCTSCHEPHGSAVAKLLVQQTFDLCVNCHSTDTMVGANGRKLQNIKAWLDTNKTWHGPVAAKDCSSCHAPHGADHFRLLTDDYPPEFYAPYDARAYALCFSCHQEKAYSTARTTTLTSFRNGDVNLHYLHLQQAGRGRTCRACHEVHASQQPHHLREGVPYGSGGWVLKLNYRKTADGGSCAKTCHTEKGYVNAARK
jgi:predicted CXXCH cytochrome family protein